MARVKLMPNMSIETQIRAAQRAIQALRSGKGPVWLLPSMEKRLRQLIEEKKRRAERQRKVVLW